MKTDFFVRLKLSLLVSFFLFSIFLGCSKDEINPSLSCVPEDMVTKVDAVTSVLTKYFSRDFTEEGGKEWEKWRENVLVLAEEEYQKEEDMDFDKPDIVIQNFVQAMTDKEKSFEFRLRSILSFLEPYKSKTWMGTNPVGKDYFAEEFIDQLSPELADAMAAILVRYYPVMVQHMERYDCYSPASDMFDRYNVYALRLLPLLSNPALKELSYALSSTGPKSFPSHRGLNGRHEMYRLVMNDPRMPTIAKAIFSWKIEAEVIEEHSGETEPRWEDEAVDALIEQLCREVKEKKVEKQKFKYQTNLVLKLYGQERLIFRDDILEEVLKVFSEDHYEPFRQKLISNHLAFASKK